MQPETTNTTTELQERVINIDRVARVVKGGRRFRFRALVAVGDGKGRIGIATAKAKDVTTAVEKAGHHAKKHTYNVTIHNGTIPHEVNAKHSGGHVLLRPAGPGTGVIAGGAVRDILEVAGYTDILSKSLGSPNKLNTSYATLKALQQLLPAPHPEAEEATEAEGETA